MKRLFGELMEQAARNASCYYDNIPKPRWNRWGLLVIPYLALLWYLSAFQEVITGDGYYYCAWTVHSTFPVVYPGLIWIFRFVIPDAQTAGTVVSMVAMCGNVMLVYLLAKRFMSDRWAFVTALLFALTPISLRSGVLVMSEATYLFFVLLSFYFFQRRDVLFGLFAGLAFLTRPEAAVFFGALVIFHFIKHRKVSDVAWMVGVFSVIVLLSSTVSWLAGASFVLTRKAMELTNTGYKLEYFANLWSECETLVRCFGAPLAVLFLFAVWKKPLFLLLACVQFFLFPLLSGFPNDWRFIFPYLPFVLIVTIAYLASIKQAYAIVAVVLIVIGFLPTLDYATRLDEPFTELKYAGIALKPYVNEQTILMGKKSYTAFYAGLGTKQFIHIPNVSLAELHSQAKLRGVTYLVASRRVMQIFHPQLIGLFDSVQCAGKFIPFGRMCPGTGHEVIILGVK